MKIQRIILSSMLVIFLAFTFCAGYVLLLWSGALDDLRITEVASYSSPNENYTLHFQQRGDPDFPFGETHVRFVVTDRNDERKSEYVKTDIADDGAIACPENVLSVEWAETSVTVVLHASEMEDKTVVIKFVP